MSRQRSALNEQDQEGQPWYRQFWGWFVFTPLFVVIIASLFFVSTAFKHADDVVVDNYYKEGRMINQRFELDKRAVALGIAGELRFDRESGEVFLTLQARESLEKTLRLDLNHPASENLDRSVVLTAVSVNSYRGDLDRALDHRWYIRIQADTESVGDSQPEALNNTPWRLNGTIDFAHSDIVSFGQ